MCHRSQETPTVDQQRRSLLLRNIKLPRSFISWTGEITFREESILGKKFDDMQAELDANPEKMKSFFLCLVLCRVHEDKANNNKSCMRGMAGMGAEAGLNFSDGTEEKQKRVANE